MTKVPISPFVPIAQKAAKLVGGELAILAVQAALSPEGRKVIEKTASGASEGIRWIYRNTFGKIF